MAKIKLNPQQQQAANITSGAAMIIAGAGSGKTRVITSRIENLLENTEQPEKIIALTFTNKAAREMKERLQSKLQSLSRKPFIGTFHSYCLFLLQRFSKDFALEQFSILDPTDQTALLKSIIKKFSLEKEYTPRKIQYHISARKNSLDFSTSNTTSQNNLDVIFQKYEDEKAKSNSLDFDDIIGMVYKKLKNSSDFLTKIQEKIDHILIDEYQDTNAIQHDLIKRLACNQAGQLNITSIFAVGDEDQSIYSWRGAIVENVERFKQDFKPVKLVKIEQNYRSVDSILQAANLVISQNTKRNPKNLWSDKKKQNRLVHASCKNEYQEAQTCTLFINSIFDKHPEESITILYRNHSQSRILEEALIRQKINYDIIGGIKFYERKEIKDIIAYLKLIVNTSDITSFYRVINCPARGLGEKFVEQFQEIWDFQEKPDFKFILLEMLNLTNCKSLQKKGIEDFLNIFKNLNTQSQPSIAVEQILNQTQYFAYLRKNYDEEEAKTKIENVDEFINSIRKFEELYSNTNKATISLFLHEIALIQEQQDLESEENSNKKVNLMTLHSAKGLEFDNVIIVALEEGSMPSMRSSNFLPELEEERRLFYVGMTRAKERLLLLSVKSRNEYGSIIQKATSRFISEITDNLIQKCSFENNSDILTQNNLTNWLNDKKLETETFSKESLNYYRNLVLNKMAKRQNLNLTTTRTMQNKTFKAGARVLHKSFGLGRILEETGNNIFKIQFSTGIKSIKKDFLTKIGN